MTNSYFLGIDVGTSALKVAVTDRSFQLIALQERSYTVDSGDRGWMELNVETVWERLLECLEALKTSVSLEQIAGIGLSCLCPGLVAMDAQGNALTGAILYSDKRSFRQAEEILDRVGGDRMFEITANQVMPGAISGTSMLWIKEERPDIYERTDCFGHLNTYLLSRLTGQRAIDPSNASYTGLFQVKTGSRWSEELCDRIGIDREKLPPVRQSFEVCGRVNERHVISCGIPEGTPVVIGGADTACAAVASGVTKACDVFESFGTTDVLTICVDRPVFSRRLLNRCYVLEGKWIYQAVFSSAGSSVDWACSMAGLSGVQQQEPQKKLLEDSAPGCNGLLFLPYLNGERSPVWDADARGVLCGITPNTNQADLFRSAIEGNAFAVRQLLEIAEELIGPCTRPILQTGGGSRQPAWTQIKADITGKHFAVPENCHTASVGAAVLASVGCGGYPTVEAAVSQIAETPKTLVTPRSTPDQAELYEEQYQRFLKLYPAFQSVFRAD